MENKTRAITPEEMKKRLEGCADKSGCEHCESEWRCKLEADARACIEQQEQATRVLVDALAGVERVHLYFATKGPIEGGKLPEDACIAYVNHNERKYIALIDDMAYGTAVCRRTLKPFELVALRLTSAPRD